MGSQVRSLPHDDAVALVDPICGQFVHWKSAHRHVHGGALFCFCSDVCRAQFAAHPARLAFLALSGGARNTKEGAERSAGDSGAAAEHDHPTPEPLTVRDERPAASRHSARPAEAQGGSSFQVLRGWRERRMAAQCCRTLLRIYKAVAAEQPQLSGTRLYEAIVVTHRGCGAREAREMINKAQQSFAAWPVDRHLSFRDVVHYLAVTEIFAAESALPWTRADIKRVVGSAIPLSL